MLDMGGTLLKLQTRRSPWSRLPKAFKLVVKLQLLAVVLALFIALGVTNVGAHQGYERIAFAVPAAGDVVLPWHSQVDAFGIKVSQAFGVRRNTATEFAGWILEASQRQGLEPELIASLVLTESSFRKNVTSHVGAIGPAQVRPELWSGFCGSSNLTDPEENIYCGAQVLSHLAERCGDYQCGLRAYNVGIHSSRVQAGLRYVTKIDGYRDQLLKLPL